MLDSSILIAAEKSQLGLSELLSAEARTAPVCISTVVASELLHGCERAPAGGRKGRRKRFVEDLLDAIPAAPFGLDEARTHARLWAQLERKGQIIGAHDLIIAATCLHLRCKLATLNEKEFRRVPGLELIDSGKYVVGR